MSDIEDKVAKDSNDGVRAATEFQSRNAGRFLSTDFKRPGSHRLSSDCFNKISVNLRNLWTIALRRGKRKRLRAMR